MKELEKWDNNPREMWVWDGNVANRRRAFVVYIRDKADYKSINYPVLALGENGVACSFMHCAELSKPKRMTDWELAQWLAGANNRFVLATDGYVYSYWNVKWNHKDFPVPEGVKIREDDGEWREPLTEVDDGEGL